VLVTRKAYSCGITLRKALALARLQSATSSLVLVMAIIVVEAMFQKTLAFLSFQTSHDPNIARDVMAFLFPLLMNHLILPFLDASHSIPTCWIDVINI
jgi:hypothetical protein